jgi:excisionase family DNA binding protein
MTSEEVFTMRQAAQRKGVSYHTVSRAVRSGRLPSRRLGRQALIAEEDLAAWQPMRERAPKRYRRPAPDLSVLGTGVMADTLDRAALEKTVTACATILLGSLHALSDEQLHAVQELLTSVLR